MTRVRRFVSGALIVIGAGLSAVAFGLIVASMGPNSGVSAEGPATAALMLGVGVMLLTGGLLARRPS